MMRISNSNVVLTFIFTCFFLGMSFNSDAQRIKMPTGNVGGGESPILLCYDPGTPELTLALFNNCLDNSGCNQIHFKTMSFFGYTPTNNPLGSSGIIVQEGNSAYVTFQFSNSDWANILNNHVSNSNIIITANYTYSIKEKTLNNNPGNFSIGSDKKTRASLYVWSWSNTYSVVNKTMKWKESIGCNNSNTFGNFTPAPRLTQNDESNKIIISPNPAKRDITIDYTLKEDVKVSAFLYNVIGQKVKVILDKELQTEGSQSINTSIEDLDPGIYYLIINEGNRTRTEKIVKT